MIPSFFPIFLHDFLLVSIIIHMLWLMIGLVKRIWGLTMLNLNLWNQRRFLSLDLRAGSPCMFVGQGACPVHLVASLAPRTGSQQQRVLGCDKRRLPSDPGW